MLTQEIINWAKNVPLLTMIEAISTISKIEDVFEYPPLALIGNKERQEALVQSYVQEIFACAGRYPENTQKEIRLFIVRFVTKYGNYTIGDIKMFADLTIEGTFDTRYLTVSELFNAWKKYLILRHQTEIEIEDSKHKSEHEAYINEKAGDDFASEIVARIRKRIISTTSWWDDFLASRPKGWQPTYDNRGVNVEYEEYRQQRLTQFALQ